VTPNTIILLAQEKCSSKEERIEIKKGVNRGGLKNINIIWSPLV
jgi:hypothetical protein